MTGARQRWAALGVLCASLLAIVIDNTIVNVALPTLVRDLEAGVADLPWVVAPPTPLFAGPPLLPPRAGWGACCSWPARWGTASVAGARSSQGSGCSAAPRRVPRTRAASKG